MDGGQERPDLHDAGIFMLLVLIAIIWLSTIVIAVALCFAAASGDDDKSRGAVDAPNLASIHGRNVIRIPGETADAAHGARGHLPSSVLAPPAGLA
ncbi:MAG TPA: hypothetical protein VHT27_13420 [Solirubrobacteraceae bacterium]|jgi:hypothetical protein|nr:hypothetical protein [Solirubrobacteraceae bacterium]